jgi:hypothetical protein
MTTTPPTASPKLAAVPPPPLDGGPLYQLLDSLIALRLGFANGTDGEKALRSISRAKVLEVRTILDTAIHNTKVRHRGCRAGEGFGAGLGRAMDSNTAQIAELVKRLLVVPDKLVTAQLCLRPLSHGDPIAASTETMLTINDACDLCTRR